MKVIHTVIELSAALEERRRQGATIALVPTMGALHAGHAALVKRAVAENACTVVSVFVNPTQFNDPADLQNYPRMLDADLALLDQLGVDYAFAPSVEEMYPAPDTRTFSYPPIDTVMEGARRPGHFNGVCQVVSRLFLLVKPQRAYFGEKDFQQIAVIRAMVSHLQLPVEICPCPIVREPSGLALSSRNALLSLTERTQLAPTIARVLHESVDYAATHTIVATQHWVVSQLNGVEGLEVEYFEIVDGLTLQSVNSWTEADQVVGCITVYCGQRRVRLIDNVSYRN